MVETGIRDLLQLVIGLEFFLLADNAEWKPLQIALYCMGSAFCLAARN